MKRIAIIYPYFALYRLPVIRALAERGEELGYAFDFFSDTQSNVSSLKLIDPNLLENRNKCGFNWNRLRNIWFGKLALWQRGVLRIALSSNYDALVFLGDRRYVTVWLGSIIARITGKKVFFWTHGYKAPYKGLSRPVVKLFHKLPNGLLLYGNRAVTLAQEEGIPPERLFVIYNSLDFEKQQDYLKQVKDDQRLKIRDLFPNPTVPLLVFCGRLVKDKRPDLLIKALGRLNERGKPYNLIFIGSGPILNDLRVQAEEEGVAKQVRFTGACYDEKELATWFSSTDLFVCPGDTGLGCIHAMGYGLPVITHSDMNSQGPEVEAIIPGKTGAMFDTDDPESLATTIEEWTAPYQDTSQVHDTCIERIRSKYTPANQVSCIANALDSFM